MRFKHRAQVSDLFAAAHTLRGTGGPCARNHGHNWRVTVVVEADELDEHGMVVDFLALKAGLRRILDRYEHRDLNEIEPFDAALNPTAENVARTIAQALCEQEELPGRLVEVHLAEAEGMEVSVRIVDDEAGS